MKRPVDIPRLAFAFFKFYCKKNRFEELHGDLEEYFYERVESKGMVKAKWFYVRDVLRCCQPYAWKTPHIYQNSNIIMFKNYFKTASRSALRNPLSTFINLFGLSLAIGVCITIYAFYSQSLNTDRHHVNKDSVFLTTMYANRDGGVKQYGMSPLPLATYVKDEVSGIVNTCRVDDHGVVIRLNDQAFYEDVRLVDPAFMEMFTFPIKWGNAKALEDLNSIIISEYVSEKYFGTENPIDKEVLLVFKSGEKKYFKIAAVAEDFPDGAEIRFDFLINYENIEVARTTYNPNDWSAFVDATFVQVESPENVWSVKSGLGKYKSLQNEVNEDWKITDFDMVSLHDLYLASENIERAISSDKHKPGRVILPFIGVFMLALACFNYLNMAINSVAKRLKEIGVRKVMGADKRRIMIQFLAENVFITSFALLFGFFLGVSLFIPWFEGISGDSYTIKLTDQLFYTFLLGLLMITGIASGVYPAFYISKFEAVKIFKGKIRLGNKSWLTKSFLAFQMILAIITITGAVLFIENTNYQKERNWGYDQADLLYLHTFSEESYQQMKAELEQLPEIETISGSAHHVARISRSTVVENLEEKIEVSELQVEPGYLKTLGVNMNAGNYFTPNLQNAAKEIIVNETFLTQMNLDDPLGQKLSIRDQDYLIVGIVQDFHFSTFGTLIKPTIFSAVGQESLRFITAEVTFGKEIETFAEVEAIWDKLYPEIPFDGNLQANVWDGYFALISNFARFNKSVAGVAVILAMLGLYGLITLNLSGRIKEFSIRKTLGANASHLGKIISKEYWWLTAITLVFGAPLGFYAAKFQMDIVFAYPIDMGSRYIIIPVVILLLLMVTVLLTQLLKVMKFNPVKGLRSE